MMVCERQDPRTTCPKLECDESEIIHIQDECCPVCKGKKLRLNADLSLRCESIAPVKIAV